MNLRQHFISQLNDSAVRQRRDVVDGNETSDLSVAVYPPLFTHNVAVCTCLISVPYATDERATSWRPIASSTLEYDPPSAGRVQ